MIVTDHPEPSPARGSMRGEQLSRVDLEPADRIGGHVAALQRLRDMPVVAEQQPARLFLPACGDMVTDGGKRGA